MATARAHLRREASFTAPSPASVSASAPPPPLPPPSPPPRYSPSPSSTSSSCDGIANFYGADIATADPRSIDGFPALSAAAAAAAFPHHPHHPHHPHLHHLHESPPPPFPSILQPRVAVVLNVPPPWHPWLFALRLCSILPALWWGLPSLLRLLLHLLPGPPDHFLVVRPVDSSSSSSLTSSSFSSSSCALDYDARTTTLLAAPYTLTETSLATIWCFACGYLSFFFTDCLMSRWLINYTPQATIVRLLSINAVNAYLTLSVLSLTGGFEDPRLLLPGWVGIATTLTVCYHITHQKINIRKETSTSVNVFSMASYVTMVTLLAHMQSYQSDYPTMPVVTRGRLLWHEVLRLVAHVKTMVNEHAEL